MNAPPSVAIEHEETTVASWRFADGIALSKPRLSMLGAFIAAAGFYLGWGGGPIALGKFFHAFMGTFVLSAGAMALNMYLERDLDGRMERTRQRPLPAGRMTPMAALIEGVFLCIAGMVWLALGCNMVAAAVGAFTVLLYVLVYTPLKPVTNLCTIIGAVPGALPPVIGWAAATGHLEFGAWVLFSIMFLWQMPHFLAIAWLCREDYARAGMPMLSVIDVEGRVTARQVLIYSVALMPVTFLPYLCNMAGAIYLFGTVAVGIWFLYQSVVWMKARHDRSQARRLFGLSLLQITVIFALMVFDKR